MTATQIVSFDAHPRFRDFRLETPELRVTIIEHGGTLTSIEAPDRHGTFANVLLGCPTLDGYLGRHPHFNCLVGRYANRIADARFRLDGRTHELDANVPPHQLHGGRRGFGVRHWEGSVEDDAVVLHLTSEDGDCGYPGTLRVTARYRLVGNRLTLDFEARTDAPTPVSLTSHGYFNLSGVPASTVLDHEIAIAASRYLPVSEELLQMGEQREVTDSPFELRRGVVLGERLTMGHPQLARAGGFDHTFVLARPCGRVGSSLRELLGLRARMREGARVHHPASGRTLTVHTDQPGVQLYTGNTLDDFDAEGVPFTRHGALCLETQQFPNAPNHAAYLRHCPKAILRPGEVWRGSTAFVFGVEGG